MRQQCVWLQTVLTCALNSNQLSRILNVLATCLSGQHPDVQLAINKLQILGTLPEAWTQVQRDAFYAVLVWGQLDYWKFSRHKSACILSSQRHHHTLNSVTGTW